MKGDDYDYQMKGDANIQIKKIKEELGLKYNKMEKKDNK